jgi:type VI secretion system secreted protein VgrG
MVQNDETQSVGMNQRVSVGVNRTTHVGRSDRLQVGAQYKAEVVPPPGSRPPTVVTMVDEQIVLDTGAGARITLSGEEILIEAVKISVVGDKELLAKVQRGDLSLVGGPKVKVNC